MPKSADAFRTISEVADWLELPTHVLRFWESKFTQVKPVKRAGGRRYYRPNDMMLLAGIKHLLHVDGMTIKAVQQKLRTDGAKSVALLSPPLDGSDPDAIIDEIEVEAEPIESTPVVDVPVDNVSDDVTVPVAAAPPMPETPAPEAEAPEAETPESEASEPEIEMPIADDQVPEAPFAMDATEEDYAPRDEPVVVAFNDAQEDEPVEDPAFEAASAEPEPEEQEPETPIVEDTPQETLSAAPTPEDAVDAVEPPAQESQLPSFLQTPLNETTEPPEDIQDIMGAPEAESEDDVAPEELEAEAEVVLDEEALDAPAPTLDAEPVAEQEPEQASAPEHPSQPEPAQKRPAHITVPDDPADFGATARPGLMAHLLRAKDLEPSQIARVVPLYNRLDKLAERLSQND